MAYREASAKAPTVYTVSLMDELTSLFNMGGSTLLREARLREALERRKDEVTMTLCLLLSEGHFIAYVMNGALLGMTYNKDAEREVVDHKPLHDTILLQSLRTHCPHCADNACGRKEQCHNIIYKTGTKSGTAADHRQVVNMGGTRENNIECDVDPLTGYFRLTALEAKKCLRQFGEYVVRKRWRERDTQKGDRWLVREPRHYELYSQFNPQGTRKDVHAMQLE